MITDVQPEDRVVHVAVADKKHSGGRLCDLPVHLVANILHYLSPADHVQLLTTHSRLGGEAARMLWRHLHFVLDLPETMGHICDVLDGTIANELKSDDADLDEAYGASAHGSSGVSIGQSSQLRNLTISPALGNLSVRNVSLVRSPSFFKPSTQECASLQPLKPGYEYGKFVRHVSIEPLPEPAPDQQQNGIDEVDIDSEFDPDGVPHDPAKRAVWLGEVSRCLERFSMLTANVASFSSMGVLFDPSILVHSINNWQHCSSLRLFFPDHPEEPLRYVDLFHQLKNPTSLKELHVQANTLTAHSIKSLRAYSNLYDLRLCGQVIPCNSVYQLLDYIPPLVSLNLDTPELLISKPCSAVDPHDNLRHISLPACVLDDDFLQTTYWFVSTVVPHITSFRCVCPNNQPISRVYSMIEAMATPDLEVFFLDSFNMMTLPVDILQLISRKFPLLCEMKFGNLVFEPETLDHLPKHLTALTFYHSAHLTDEVLARLVSKYPQLTEFKLVAADQITDAGVRVLAKLPLRKLEIAAGPTTKITKRAVFDIIAQMPHLIHFQMPLPMLRTFDDKDWSLLYTQHYRLFAKLSYQCPWY